MCCVGGKGKKKGTTSEGTHDTGTGRFDQVEESQSTDTNTEHQSDGGPGVEMA